MVKGMHGNGSFLLPRRTFYNKEWLKGDSHGGLVVKNSPSNAGDLRDVGLIPGQGRSPRGGNSNPLQHSCLENPMDGGT